MPHSPSSTLREDETVPHPDLWEETRAPSLVNSALLAVIGGFLDGFTYVTHGVFANAMTGNVVLLGIYGVAHSWHKSLRHLPPIITFLFGISAARALFLPAVRTRIRFPYVTVLSIEMFIIGILSLLPNDTRAIWITTSIAFAASMQVETFRKVNGRNFNSTFTTGNLRSLSEGLFDWIFRNNVADARTRSRDFAVICGAFLLGAILGGTLASRFGNPALWLDFALLSVVLIRLWPVTASAVPPQAAEPHSGS